MRREQSKMAVCFGGRGLSNPAVICLFLVVFGLHCSSAAKIAVLTFPNGISHFFMQQPIGRELEARGHEVTYIMCSMEPKSATVKVNKLLIYHLPQYPVNYFVSKTAVTVFDTGYIRPSDIKSILQIFTEACDALLSNETLLAQLEGTDLLFADNSFAHCGQLLRIKARIPYIVDISNWGFNDPFSEPYGVPLPVSYIPSEMTLSSPEMTFQIRLKNVVLFITVKILMGIMSTYWGTGTLQQKHGIDQKSLTQLIGETDLVLLPLDWTLEWSRPIPPNVKMIGSTSLRPAGKLPQEFEDFMQSAEHGVVLLSFGSMITHLDEKRMATLLDAFPRLKYKVLWKFNQTISGIDNLKTVAWMPQNDILGHPRLKLFITHGGSNSFYEGCNNGVPLLVTPLWGDQFGNAEKVKAAGVGADFNIRKGCNFTADSLVDVINELIENPRYKINAMKISKLLKDRPRTAQQVGADWIEYVIRNNGTKHLRPKGLDLAFYQYFLLDVAAFLIAVVLVVVFLVVSCCRFSRNLCCRSSKQKND